MPEHPDQFRARDRERCCRVRRRVRHGRRKCRGGGRCGRQGKLPTWFSGCPRSHRKGCRRGPAARPAPRLGSRTRSHRRGCRGTRPETATFGFTDEIALRAEVDRGGAIDLGSRAGRFDDVEDGRFSIPGLDLRSASPGGARDLLSAGQFSRKPVPRRGKRRGGRQRAVVETLAVPCARMTGCRGGALQVRSIGDGPIARRRSAGIRPTTSAAGAGSASGPRRSSVLFPADASGRRRERCRMRGCGRFCSEDR